jgi:hypothetical protein
MGAYTPIIVSRLDFLYIIYFTRLQYHLVLDKITGLKSAAAGIDGMTSAAK